METGSVKRWLVLFLGILVAILIANALSGSLILLTGIGGWPADIVHFVLYAVFLFAALHILKKYGHIDIFRFDGE